MNWQLGVGWVFIILGIGAVWTGCLRSGELRRPGGTPNQLIPDYGDAVNWMFVTHAIGAALIIGGLVCLGWWP